ncbi:MAG TPA: M20/M25/M40 family metallo-hydrolase [Thermoanaerobaculia bacterium]|nr:M20/M25/M40 family metallo-hydrolase [Thermoanaerobaculia bacterium]
MKRRVPDRPGLPRRLCRHESRRLGRHDAEPPRRRGLVRHGLGCLLATVLALGGAPLLAQTGSAPAAEPSTAPAAATTKLLADVGWLASADLEGRLTGTTGEQLAAEYLAQSLADAGAEPLPGQEGYLMPFEFTSGTDDAGSSIRVTAGSQTLSWDDTADVRALSFSDNQTVRGQVVFAGYGLTVPDSQDFGYDSYATLDVTDKVVVVLRYFPEDVDGEARTTLARYSGLRYKARTARENGAKALLVVTGPRSPNAGETIPMTFDTAIAGSGIAAASISAEVAAALLSGRPDLDLAAAQKMFDDGNPHTAGFELPDVEVELDVKVRRERRTGYNVVGLLPGSDPSAPEPYVVVGAHYDHLGRGGGGNSLARKDELGGIHHGADDNASGTAAVLQIARDLAPFELDRTVVLALWSGEELGLLGSSAFLDSGAIPADQIAAYVNMDMVGRMKDNKLSAQSVGSSPVWPRLLEQANVPIGFDLQTQEDPYLPTDSASFYQAKVPALQLFTGSHADYHRPSDTAEKINLADLARVARFAGLITRRLAELDDAPDYAVVQRKQAAGGDRDAVRAFTGTIPDYTTDVEGLRLGGVMAGGPADQAGLREGDVIVRFGGATIANIYDYTYALDAVKVGVPVEVVFVRDGEQRTTTITPAARQ